jgi:hypothetical protein
LSWRFCMVSRRCRSVYELTAVSNRVSLASEFTPRICLSVLLDVA